MIYIYWFRSYSGDDFFMKSHEKNYLTAESFCKDKVKDEYAEWTCLGLNFKYNTFKIFTTDENGFVKVNRSFGEYWKIYPSDIKDYDIAYFEDEYCPKTYCIDNENGEEFEL